MPAPHRKNLLRVTGGAEHVLDGWSRRRSGESADGRGHRFAFVLHPLTVDYLGNHPRYAWTRHLPRGFVETTAAYMPARCVGTAKGGRSPATGKPVDGLIYALGATPRRC